MTVVSSSFANNSLLPDNSSSNSSLHPLSSGMCFRSETGFFIFSGIFFANLLLLPLFIHILYLGYQQWRKQRYSPTGAKTSLSDFFIYHSIAMQLNEFLGFIIFFCGSYNNHGVINMVGLRIWSVTSLGEALFHILTCVERYCAVVHPLTYRGLRQTAVVKIRNISIACIWLLCFGWVAVLYLANPVIKSVLYFCVILSFLTVSSFCSISVLRALKCPGPGEVGGNRERVDQSKQRAFHIIVAIMGVLLFRFGGNLLFNVIQDSVALTPSDLCVMVLSTFWFYLPSSVVLPLLYLHRARKLQCC